MQQKCQLDINNSTDGRQIKTSIIDSRMTLEIGAGFCFPFTIKEAVTACFQSGGSQFHP